MENLQIVFFIIAWFVLMKYVLPKMGVGT